CAPGMLRASDGNENAELGSERVLEVSTKPRHDSKWAVEGLSNTRDLLRKCPLVGAYAKYQQVISLSGFFCDRGFFGSFLVECPNIRHCNARGVLLIGSACRPRGRAHYRHAAVNLRGL